MKEMRVVDGSVVHCVGRQGNEHGPYMTSSRYKVSNQYNYG